MERSRKSGILLHPSSLPGKGGIGSFGEEAYKFVDLLARAGQSLWQVLPLGPTGYGDSPYSAYSAFAGNPLLIDLAAVAVDGDLELSCLKDELPEEWVDYGAVKQHKLKLLHQAASRFLDDDKTPRKRDFWHFCDTTQWLHDFALFMSLNAHFHGKPWSQWPADISSRTAKALEAYSALLGPSIGFHKYIQWLFFRQWQKLKQYANDHGVAIIGDMPIFVAYDSADVWVNGHIFHLDPHGNPTKVSGVPPDYFSKTGQLWGNPLYNWEVLAQEGYSWWVQRMRHDLQLYDMVRIDHFRGFEAFWEIPAGEKSAVNGRWVNGPGESVFNAMREALGSLPIIAEDLGVITPEVEALRDRLGFPGMRILQFAFGSGADNPYLPHNYKKKTIVYTGTHDNDTTVGWFATLPMKDKKQVLHYLNSDGRDVVWDLVRAALMSVADMAIFPLQDVLALDTTARMNLPGTSRGNWSWRCHTQDLSGDWVGRLLDLTITYGRSG